MGAINLVFCFFTPAPPINNDLPDLDVLMGTLDGGESELETTASPPPLLLPEEKYAKQRRIEELKQGVANDPIDYYDEEFEKRMEDEILMVGNISLEMVQVLLLLLLLLLMLIVNPFLPKVPPLTDKTVWHETVKSQVSLSELKRVKWDINVLINFI